MNKVTLNDPWKEYGIDEEHLSDFVLFLSDELRNPLSVILMELDLIMEQAKEDLVLYRKIRPLILQAKKNFLRTAKIINDKIDNIEASLGKLCPHITVFNVLGEVVELIINVNLILLDNHVSCITNLNRKELYIEADQYYIERCLLNFLSYATKNTTKGREINVTLDTDGSEIKVAVQYNGDEISNRNQLFGKDAQNRLKGCKPELELVRKLIEIHHGRVWAQNEQEGINSLYFAIPIKSEREQNDFIIRTSLNIKDIVLMELSDINSGIENTYFNLS